VVQDEKVRRASDTSAEVNAFVDASGSPHAVMSGIKAVRPGGTAVLVGLGSSEMTLPVEHIQNLEITVTGIFRYTNTWPAGIHMVASGLVELDSLVTGRFNLERADEALESDLDPDSLKSIATPTDTKKATKEQQSECLDIADFGYGRTAHVPAATAARSQSWSQLSSFVAIRKRPDDRFPSANGDLRISLDLDLRIWKAGWVHALAGSNPASSAVRILRCVTPTAKRPLLLNIRSAMFDPPAGSFEGGSTIMSNDGGP
jgi:hypothetical protein